MATAQAQGTMNADTARLNATLNRGNTYTPWGSIEQEQFAPDQWRTNVFLSPGQQRLNDVDESTSINTADAANAASQRLAAQLATPVDTSGLPQSLAANYSGIGDLQRSVAGAGEGIRTSIGGAGEGIQASVGANDFSADRTRVEQTLLDRLAPSQARDESALAARLAAQGVGQGTRAYADAQAVRQTGVNDARLGAILAGGQEQSRLFGMDVTQGQFANAAQAQGFEQRAAEAGFGNEAQAQAFGQNYQNAAFGNTARQQAAGDVDRYTASVNNQRSQGLAELLQLRAQPINEASALFGLGNGVQAPQAQPMAAVQAAPVDYSGLVAANAAQRQGASNATTGALFGLGGAALGGLTGNKAVGNRLASFFGG